MAIVGGRDRVSRNLVIQRRARVRYSYRRRKAATYFEFCADGTPVAISFLRSAAVSS